MPSDFPVPAVSATHRPDLRDAIEAMPASKWLGLRVIGFAAAGLSVLELDVRPELTFDGRVVQGGLVGTLADYAGVSAAAASLATGWGASTTGFEVHNLAPAIGDTLVAIGRAAAVGRSQAVSRVEVWAITRGRPSVMVAIATTTCRPMEWGGATG